MCPEKLFLEWIIGDSEYDVLFLREGDGDGDERNPKNIVIGAIEGVDNPSILRSSSRTVAFFRESIVGGILSFQAFQNYLLGEEILGVLNLDMVAYNTQGSQKDMDLHADEAGVPGSMDLAHLYVDVINAYNLDLVPNIWEDGLTASDHSSFWDYGYSAILAIEDWDDFTPYYHTQSDLLQTLDMTFYVEFVKASVAAFAHMGVLYDDLSGVDDVATGTAAPRITALHPGRPNPAGSSTVVRYDIAEPGAVRLTVYDARGRLVRTLVDRHHETGAYEATWDGENDSGVRTPPGVYFMSLRTSAGAGPARKIVLAR